MEKAKGFSFEDFSIEIGDFEVTKKKNYHYSFWHCTEGGSIDQRPLIYKGVIYFGSFNHNLYALNAQTGKEIWKFKAQDRIGLCSPILYRNSVIIGSYDHNVYRIDADTGKLIWKFPTFGEIASSGAIHNGICYFTCRDQFLYAIKCNNGSLVWKYKTFEPNVSVPTVHGEKVFFGSSDRNLYCLNNRNGNLIWKFQAEEEIVNVTPFIVHKNAKFPVRCRYKCRQKNLALPYWRVWNDQRAGSLQKYASSAN